jgi:AcrR family transcriptional regulator
MDAAGEQRLRSGRHELPREAVVRSQRERLTRAIAESCEEVGYAETKIADIVDRAGVSRATFYELYDGKEDLFLAALDAIRERCLAEVAAAARPEDPWPDRVRAGIEALLGFFADEPVLARLLMVEVFAAGAAARERYEETAREFAARFDQGRPDSGGEPLVGAAATRAVFGGGELLVREEILAGRVSELRRLLPELIYAALVPFVGAEEAQHQMRRAQHGPRADAA